MIGLETILALVIIVARVIAVGCFLALLIQTAVLAFWHRSSDRSINTARTALMALWASLTYDGSYRTYVWVSAVAHNDPSGTEIAASIMAIMTLIAAILSVVAFKR